MEGSWIDCYRNNARDILITHEIKFTTLLDRHEKEEVTKISKYPNIQMVPERLHESLTVCNMILLYHYFQTLKNVTLFFRDQYT